MTLPLPDPFDRFSAECSLRRTCEDLCTAPRDLLAPLSEAEQHYVVTLEGPASDSGAARPVRLVFATPLSEAASPSMRDILWWLAGDAWAIERAGGKLAAWASTYGYSADDPLAKRLFERCTRQVRGLSTLLGEADYQRLLALYEASLSSSR